VYLTFWDVDDHAGLEGDRLVAVCHLPCPLTM
jgi:hypothetical protein